MKSIEESFTNRVPWSITENFEDLRHFPSGPQVHPEAGHGTPCGQADYTGARRESQKRQKDGVTGMCAITNYIAICTCGF